MGAMYVPKLSIFSGDKDKASFDVFEYEVRSLLRIHSEEMVAEAIRRSVKGEAARIVMRVGEGAAVCKVLEKLRVRYGTVTTGETLLKQFYNGQQLPQESISQYSTRIEELLMKAKSAGMVQQGTDRILINQFWSGLANESLKTTTMFLRDQVSSFDEFTAAIRRAEEEVCKEKPLKANVQLHSNTTSLDNKLDQIMKRLEQLEVGKPTGAAADKGPWQPRRKRDPKELGPCYQCGEMGHLKFRCPSKPNLNG
jgi:hypothetical protein